MALQVCNRAKNSKIRDIMKQVCLWREEKSWQTGNGSLNVEVAAYYSAQFHHDYTGYGQRSRNTPLYTVTDNTTCEIALDTKM